LRFHSKEQETYLAKSASSLESYALSLLRIIAGFTFTLHGLQKFGALGGLDGKAAAMYSLLWVAGVIECVGGPLIILGLFTRPVAFVLSGEMAVGYFMVHVHMGPWLFPLLNMGEITVLYCFFFLYLVTAGAGVLSLDSALRKKA
jgi:putative oxidoreductase